MATLSPRTSSITSTSRLRDEEGKRQGEVEQIVAYLHCNRNRGE